MGGKHAWFSPSSAQANTSCQGKLAMEYGLQDDESEYAMEGTIAHHLAASCLEYGTNAAVYLGMSAVIHGDDTIFAYREGGREEGGWWFNHEGQKVASAKYVQEVDEDMCEHIQTYLDVVRGYARGGKVMVEQAVDISFTGEEGATGTADAVVLQPDHAIVVDLKYGMGKLVEATDNMQLAMYAIGVLHTLGDLCEKPDDFPVTCVVCQPRRCTHPDVWETTKGELLALIPVIRRGYTTARLLQTTRNSWLKDGAEELVPGDACTFCRAASNGVCCSLHAKVEELIDIKFDELEAEVALDGGFIVPLTADLTKVGQMYRMLPLVRVWQEGVENAAKKALFASFNSSEVIEQLGLKLVNGRRGRRSWIDTEKAEKVLKRLLGAKVCYETKLISPAKAEAKVGGDEWGKVEGLVTFSEARQVIALATDRRDAVDLDVKMDAVDMTEVPLAGGTELTAAEMAAFLEAF